MKEQTEIYIFTQDRQCMHKANMSSALVQTLLLWKSSKHYIFWVRVESLRYPVCNAQAPYFHQRLARFYNTSILPHYLTKGTIFERKKKVVEHKMCFDFLYTFCPKHFSL